MNPPMAKFCMECGTRLLICPHCRTANPPQAKFCIECGTALLEPTANSRNTLPLSLSEPTVNALAWSAEAEVDTTPLLQQVSAPEERRIVTIVFADITGSTPLADRLDPEEMRAILAGYFNLMTEQIRRHGGTVEKYIGDAVMAVFGLPVTHEDDPDRAIRAALDMQAALNHFNAVRLARDPEATRLQMRIGINTGEVATPGGRLQRQDFLITGDAVNVAARLQQVAVPDTILVGERTYMATRDVFAFRSLAPVLVKGKARPLHAWVVEGFLARDLAVIQHPRGIEGLSTPLVGRSLEMTLMHATYSRVRDARHAHLITLLGAPGVGKSRLVREFIARELESARCTTCDETQIEPRVLQGRCPPYGEGITYWPLVEILRSLIQVREGEQEAELEERFVQFLRETLRKARRTENVEQMAQVLLQRIGHGLRGEQESVSGRSLRRSKLNKETQMGGPDASLYRACRTLLEAIAQVQPLILVIDDLHWADEALLKLLEYLTGHMTDAPVLFFCLARPDFLDRRRDWGSGQPNATTMILEALNAEETGELVSELLNTRELPEVLLYTIRQRAEGNPFFVEEIVRMFIDQGVLVKKDGAWQISEQNEDAISDLASPAAPPDDTLIDQHYVLPLPRLPDTIQGVLAARVDLLTPVEKQVLQAASIVGRTFWVSAVLELVEGLEREAVVETLEQLVHHDFIEESEKPAVGPVSEEQSFGFKHILIRDVVYQHIPRARRAQKHVQLALWLETQVADRQELFAELLAYHYQQALTYWSATQHARQSSPDADERTATADDEATTGVALTHAELVRRTIHYLTLAGDQAYRSYYTIRAIQAYTEALDLLQEYDADKLTIARMHQKVGHAYLQRANADEAWNEYLLALQLMQQVPDISRQDLLCIYLSLAELPTRWLGWFTLWLDMEEVRSYIDQGLRLVADQPPSSEKSSFLTFQALWYIRQIKYTPVADERAEMAAYALQSALEARRIAEEINEPAALWIALDALGFIYDKQHKYSEGHITQHEREQLREMIHGREELYDLYISLGWTHLNISDYATAANWFGQAWRIAQTMESPSMLLRSLLGRMATWRQWDRWDEAREAAKQVLQAGEQYQQQDEGWALRPLELLAELAYRRGKEEECENCLKQHSQVRENCSSGLSFLPSLTLARGDWPRALQELREIEAQAEIFPSPESTSLIAELTVLAGEPVDIQAAVCERAVAFSEASGSRKFLAVALRARGRFATHQRDWNQAEQDLRRALALCQELDLPWEKGETLACLGVLYQQRADLADQDQPSSSTHRGLARLFFEQARGFFGSLHAVRDMQRIEALLLETADLARTGQDV
jgi:class 3 adenylate cyclase/tetratricopeptide (TPR) repeat protein